MSYRIHVLLLALAFSLAACGSNDDPPAETPDATPGSEADGKGDGLGDFFGDILERDEVFADMYNVTGSTVLLPVRGRLIEEEPSDFYDPEGTAMEEITQDELDEETVEVWLRVDGASVFLGELETNEEGYLDAAFDTSTLRLDEGRYDVEIYYDDERVGLYKASLLDPQRELPIVRSDVDLTYLNTDFQSASAMFGLLRESADEKETLPGMDKLYAGLRNGGALPVTYLSGSPRFFKRVLELKMKQDGLEQDGLVLKPFKDIVSSNLASFDFDELLPELKEQVGYKLYWLLRLRAQVPASTPEILMGDDSEADHVVYAVYYRFMSGEWDHARVMDEMEALGVAPDWQSRIDVLMDAVEPGTPPTAIYINQTHVAAEHFPVSEWMVEGVTRHHQGAWPLALDLWEEGMLGDEQVQAVRERLLSLGYSSSDLEKVAAESPFLEAEHATAF